MNTTDEANQTTVLVTGASGHLGSHLVTRLIDEGHPVRATVRTIARGNELRGNELRGIVVEAGGDPGRLEIATADLGSDDGWAAAMDGISYVMQVASPFPAATPEDDDL